MRRSQAPSLLRLPGPPERLKLGSDQSAPKTKHQRPTTGDLECSPQKLQRHADMGNDASASREKINSFANSVRKTSLIKSPSLMSVSEASAVSESPVSTVRSKEPNPNKRLGAISNVSTGANETASRIVQQMKEGHMKRPNESTISDAANFAEKVDKRREENELISVQNQTTNVEEEASATVSVKSFMEEKKKNVEKEDDELQKPSDNVVLASRILTEHSGGAIETNVNLINFNLVLCKPSKEQKLCIEAVLSSTEPISSKLTIIKRVLLHPGTISNVASNNWDGRESGKLAVLGKIIQGLKPNAKILIMVAGEETNASLREFFDQEKSMPVDSVKRIRICCSTEVSTLSDQFDIIVALDIFTKHYISVCERFLVHSGITNYVQLITQGTVEERLFWSNVIDDSSVEFADDDLQLCPSSFIRDKMVLRSRRFAGSVDDEFSELWPKLLDGDWHAEAGGGLVDYHYCLPGYTSKSAKGKIKGQKNVHFFTSKSKVLEYLTKHIESERKISFFELGAFDLNLWHFEPFTRDSIPRNYLFTEMTDAEVHSVYSCQQRISSV